MDQKLTNLDLSNIIALADREVPVGSRIRHKASGGTYQVLTITLREADLEPLMVYAPVDQGAPRIFWSRPVSEFRGRFEFIDRPSLLVAMEKRGAFA